MSDNNEYVWLTELSSEFLERDYLLPGQTVDDRVTAICNRAEEILNKPGFGEKFKSYFKKGWFSLSTPIWTNFGTSRGLPISCFGSHISDDLASILTIGAEVGMMSKYGGGTSAYFGDVRGRGEAIKDNGTSSGSVHFMQHFNSVTNIVSQGATRRGSFAAYLPIDHKDIEEFLTLRHEGSPIQDISSGVTVPDYWLEAMIAGDKDKRRIWAKLLASRADTGYPYILFSDTVNNNTVDVYLDKKLRINASNLCVTGDQMAVTDKGMRRVVDLYNSGEDLVLFDGHKSVNASPMRLVEKDAQVFKITTQGGRTHRVTDYHKVKTTKGMIAVKNLSVGDRVIVQTEKGLFGSVHDPKKAFLLGLYQGDGTQTENQTFIDIWENDFDLLSEIENAMDEIYTKNNFNSYAVHVPNRGDFERSRETPRFVDCHNSQNGIAKKRMGSTKLKDLGFIKGIIPNWIWESDLETQAQFIRGLYFADGTVSQIKSHGNPISLTLASIDRKYLENVQMMLANMGIRAKIYDLHKAGMQFLPDGKGGQKKYMTKDCFRLVITCKKDALRFNELTGFLNRKNVIVENRVYRDNTKKYDAIVSIEKDGIEDVYCTTVDSEEHVWVCNSFITSNCSEILLPTNDEESFVCDLSSMNILHYDDWKDTDVVETLTYFLDAVMSEFIEKAKLIPYMDRAARFAERHRAIGIGWLGWHSFLQKKMLPWESDEAKSLNKKVGRTIKKQAYAASTKMAVEYGEPEVLKGYGRRNTTLLAIAPTKSSAFILGQVSEGIEPHRANYYIKDLAKGKFSIRNEALVELLETKGANTPAIWDSILKNKGSVQHLVDVLSEHERNVFKTFQEISPQEIIIQAADRQKYIDQSQSLNLMISPKTPIKEVNQLLIDAWKLGVKTLYYQISVNAAQEFSRQLICESCSA